jgi:hypothetical protein
MKKFIKEAQRKFKLFKQNEKLTGDCISQNHDEIKMEEKWMLYPINGGTPETYYLRASEPHCSTHVRYPNGNLVSISEIEISSEPSIPTTY